MPPFKILICEDSADMREYLRILLGGCRDFELASVFVTGEEAVAAAAQLAPDVVIMDIELPGISGIESTRLIKKILPHTHIIMYTVYEDNEKLFDSLCAGASGYLLKKTPPDQLTKAISEVMEGGSPMSPGIAQKVVQYFHKLPKKIRPPPLRAGTEHPAAIGGRASYQNHSRRGASFGRRREEKLGQYLQKAACELRQRGSGQGRAGGDRMRGITLWCKDAVLIFFKILLHLYLLNQNN